MNKDIMKPLSSLFVFTALLFWQLTQLVKDGNISLQACFWVVVNIVFIAFAAANLVRALEK